MGWVMGAQVRFWSLPGRRGSRDPEILQVSITAVPWVPGQGVGAYRYLLMGGQLPLNQM